ncbi:MAG: helix-turn-helix domain-containing protein [Acidobacteria bacterium]|nr:helix-turn-helix domain-containing protein [Acidobacteriota bacterium]
MTLKLREMISDEQAAIKRLARSRTASAREVERARIIEMAGNGERVPAIAARLEVAAKTVRTWLKRFNADGVDGLRDRPRAGRPTTFTPEQISEVIAAALTNPQELELPFGCWTLDRLAVYLREQKDIAIKRSRIDELLVAEGLRWRKQEAWFGERVDPEFAKKRGASNNFIPPRQKGVS